MRQRTIAIIALAAIILLLAASPALLQNTLGDWFRAFESFSVERPALALGAFVFLAAISVLLGPFTSTPTVPFAVAAWGEPGTVALLMFGWLLGGMLAYALGMWVGEPLVKRIVGKEKLKDWLEKIRPRLDFLTLLLFRLAMPSETGYVFGLLRYSFGSYVVITILAEIPFALITAYGSAALLYSSPTALAITVTAWVLLIAIALRLFLRRIRKT